MIVYFFAFFSLLAVDACNRRTATVISKGFTDLFVLSKKDVYNILSEYPDAQDKFRHKAKYVHVLCMIEKYY